MSGRMEWMLDTDSKIFDGMTEAEFLAKSIKDVANHYPTNFLDQKGLDWANLVQCLAMVYGGRIFAIRSTPKPKPAPQPARTVFTSSMQPNPPRTTPIPTNDFAPGNGAGRVDIAGVGSVEFPDDDPRSPNYKPRFN